MRTTTKRWQLRPHDDGAIQHLTRSLRISPVVAQLLFHRGITDPAEGQRFLTPVMSALHPPRLLPGVTVAAELVQATIQAAKRIRIFGDYDTDGVTGTAILVKLIEHLGGKVDYHIPHRMDEGYGLNVEAVRKAREEDVGLLITVDCGITAVTEAAEARRLGVRLIITDHHEMKDELPDADAVVHPRAPGSAYPFAGLSGSGVAFKLAWVIAQQFSGGAERVTPELRAFLLEALGLAALGLVADVVPIRDENRIFVKHGLARLAAQPSLGLKALIEAAKLTGTNFRAEDISFKLAPRLNAAGRLGCALSVVELLTTKSPVKARDLADWLEQLNKDRQTIERRITTAAKALLAEQKDDDEPAIVLGSEDWHQGVIGIVASRLMDQFGKPTVLVSLKPGDEPSTGSGRSLPGLELHQALRACDDCLLSHGGHAAAAGLKILPSQLDEFRARFQQYVRTQFPSGLPPPPLWIDAEVPLAVMTLNLLKDLDQLEPYGAANPKPRFLATELTIEGTPRRMGNEERHLNFRLRQGVTVIRAVAFGMGDRLDELMSAGGQCSVVFTPKLNEWNGYRNVEMEVIDFRPGATPDLAN